MYYTVIKHDGHLRTRGKCRKHEKKKKKKKREKERKDKTRAVGECFYLSRVLLNVRSVLSQCKIGLRLLHLLYDIQVE